MKKLYIFYWLLIGYIGNKVKPLNIMLPKNKAYVKSYDGQTRWMGVFFD